MTDDPSKYLHEAERMRQRYAADGVFVVVLGGVRGSGGCPAIAVPNGADGRPDAAVLSQRAAEMVRIFRLVAGDLERRFVLPVDRSS